MTQEVQRIEVQTLDVVAYSLQHYGMYFGEELTEKHDEVKGLDKAWMATHNFKLITAPQIAAWNRLCIAMLDHDPRIKQHLTGEVDMPEGTQTLEVSANPYRNYKTGEIRFFVEPQHISAGFVGQRSMDTTRPPIDLLTGEEMHQWWDEWHPYGRFHSHNIMGVSPSLTDNNSELTAPGVCCIFGTYKPDEAFPGGYAFRVNPSIVTPNPDKPKENMRRILVAEEQEDGTLVTRRMTYGDIFEWDPEDETTFHENVWKNILFKEPEAWKKIEAQSTGPKIVYASSTPTTYGQGYGYGYGGTYKGGYSAGDYNANDDVIDAAARKHQLTDKTQNEVVWRTRTILNIIKAMMEKAGEELFDVQAYLSDVLYNTQGMDVTWGFEDEDLQPLDEWDTDDPYKAEAIRDFLLEYECEGG